MVCRLATIAGAWALGIGPLEAAVRWLTRLCFRWPVADQRLKFIWSTTVLVLWLLVYSRITATVGTKASSGPGSVAPQKSRFFSRFSCGSSW
jgi:hypothetical protein